MQKVQKFKRNYLHQQISHNSFSFANFVAIYHSVMIPCLLPHPDQNRSNLAALIVDILPSF